MGVKKRNPLMIWILGLVVCAMLRVPVWGMILASLGYGVLLLLLHFKLSVFWAGYFIHGIWNKPETARKLYDYGYDHGVRAAAPMIAYAMLLMEDGRYPLALEVLQEVQERPDLNQTMRLVSRQDLAIAWEKNGDISRAIEEMEKIRQEYECLGSNFYSNLAYFYIQAGDFDKAEEINDLPEDTEKTGAYYDNLALIAWGKEDKEQAKLLFEKALAENEAMVSPKYYLGMLAEEEGNLDTAENYFRMALSSGITGLSTISRHQVEERLCRYANGTERGVLNE